MHNVRQIAEDTFYVGVTDNRTALFENIHPLPEGVTYNSYVILDEKTAVMDTVDWGFALNFFENVEHVLDGRELDYIVINHFEPDHASSLGQLMQKYPNATVVMSTKGERFARNFGFDLDNHKYMCVKEGDTLELGKHTLTFVEAPMVHWPEVMVTLDLHTGVLYSADAFGTFGTLDGRLFDDEVDFEGEFLDHARRYFCNIVGKYGKPTMTLLGKAGNILDKIKMFAPLHGPVWRTNLQYYIDKHVKWASYEPEEEGVLIVYGSMYGNTENVANIMATELVKRGITKIKMYDASKTHHSYIIADAFKYSHILVASVTYNLTLYPPVKTLLEDMIMLNLQNRKVALVENGSWSPQAGRIMTEMFGKMKNMEIINEKFTHFTSSLREDKYDEIIALVDAIAKTFEK
ncbi:MAG: FprA family A-type flavoprotein [Tissierellia bacterium]|nr:FprA family A-type flavoprotein [Tissierellia bacterium]